jgi:hypothetical protein
MRKIPAIEAIGVLIIVIIEPIVDAVDPTKTTRPKTRAQVPSYKQMQTTINTVFTCTTRASIENEIEKTSNKTLVVSKTFGTRDVKYYDHKMRDFTVKNDSIMLHLDNDAGNVIEYQKTWTDLSINTSEFESTEFEPKNYHWKERVVFPDKEDCSYFYSFSEEMQFPILCWEVRHTNGTTVMYNATGVKIGEGVPAPSDGFALSGYDKKEPHDPWRMWRDNAASWLQEWCDRTISISSPENEIITKYISDPSVTMFYEIGHSGGLPTRFQSEGDQIYYTADMVRDSLADRSPMKFTMLCSCEAMQETGPGTLSYEFRKGQTRGTVTIGYVGMGTCPGWADSLDWQNSMFRKINSGLTVENAFTIACAQFPKIADCVELVGDATIKIVDDPEEVSEEADDRPKINRIDPVELIGQVITRIQLVERYVQNIKIKKIVLN